MSCTRSMMKSGKKGSSSYMFLHGTHIVDHVSCPLQWSMFEEVEKWWFPLLSMLHMLRLALTVPFNALLPSSIVRIELYITWP